MKQTRAGVLLFCVKQKPTSCHPSEIVCPKPGKTVLPIKRSGGKFAITSDELEGAEAVIHLAGENIATGALPLGIQAWTGGKKDEIMRSRVEGTAQIVSTINACKNPPKVLVCASAVGLYGYDSGDAQFSETSPKGNGFLAEVVDKWEQESSKAKCRVVNARFGVVLSKQAGALAKLLPIFQLGGGGILGDGKQYFPFVSERDAVSAVKFLATSGNAKGPYNIAAPVPATNADFTAAMGSALSRPTILPFPGFAAKALFGQMVNQPSPLSPLSSLLSPLSSLLSPLSSLLSPLSSLLSPPST